MQNAVRLIVAVAVSAACFVFATWGTVWGDVGARVREAHLGWALAVVAVSCGCHVLRAERWRVLLRPVGAVPRGPAIGATFIGFGASMVLPFRLGEVVRPAVLGRRVGISTSAALSSVVLERLFDILLVVCCFFVVGLVYDVPAYLRAGAFTLGIGTAIGFVVLVLMARNREAASRVLRRLVDVLPVRVGGHVWPVVDGLLQGLGGLAQLSTILLVLGYSAILWTAIMFTYLFSFLALDLPVPLVAASLTTVVVVAAFVFLPQAPGFVGTWQAGCVLALGLFHVAQDPAVTYSLLTWVIQLVVNVGGALVFMAFQDLSVRQLVAAAEEQP